MARRIAFRHTLILLMLSVCVNVYSAPTNTISYTNPPVDDTIVEASDHNAYLNETSTKFNAHDHNDIDLTTNNSFTIGNSAAGNKTYFIDNGDTNLPFIRYIDTNNQWVFSNDGLTSGIVQSTANSDNIIWKTTNSEVLNLSNQGAVAFTDLDLTASTSATATMAILELKINNTTTGEWAQFEIRKNGDTTTGLQVQSPDEAWHTGNSQAINNGIVGIDAGQVCEYKISTETSSTVNVVVTVVGYIE